MSAPYTCLKTVRFFFLIKKFWKIFQIYPIVNIVCFLLLAVIIYRQIFGWLQISQQSFYFKAIIKQREHLHT